MRKPKRLASRGYDRSMSGMHVSELRRCIKHYFLNHPAIRAIEPVVRGTKRGCDITSPFFAPGLTVAFTGDSVDVMFAVKNSISDWMGTFFCTPTRIGYREYICDDCLKFYESEHDGELADHGVYVPEKYVSERAMYEIECLDPLIKNIESGKFLQAIEWKEWDGSGAAHFGGFQTSIGNRETQWVYPPKRFPNAAG